MDKRIDLHTHSTASDGTMTPEALITFAKQKDLQAIALTDHDTIQGLHEAKVTGQQLGMEVISGIELSTYYHGMDIHILGLFIDETNPLFLEKLNDFIASRNARNDKMLLRLNELGLKVTKEDLLATSNGGSITRAHVSRMLLNKGYVKSLDEAFEKYIGEGKPAFIPREKITPEQGIQLIHQAKGLSFIAHPLLYPLTRVELGELITNLASKGLSGIEAIYSNHSLLQEHYLKKLASDNGLLISGGSDFHGSNKPAIDLGSGFGKLRVPYKVLKDIKAHL